jgi:hypothetical protein
MREHPWLSPEICKQQPLAKGSFSIEAPLIYIVCLHGWPAAVAVVVTAAGCGLLLKSPFS